MKSTRAPKMILNNALLEEEFFEEAVIIGLVSAKKSHQFIYSVNQGTGFHFVRNHDFEVQVGAEYFTVFYYEEAMKQTEYFIFCNRNKTAYLIPEAKNVDYIWLIKSASFLQSAKAEILPLLPKLPSIDYAFEINHAQLKSKQYLII
jgi:hypothetical protein